MGKLTCVFLDVLAERAGHCENVLQVGGAVFVGGSAHGAEEFFNIVFPLLTLLQKHFTAPYALRDERDCVSPILNFTQNSVERIKREPTELFHSIAEPNQWNYLKTKIQLSRKIL